MTQVSLSILSADFLHLQDQLSRVEPFVDRLHYDVMDGHFVDQISFGLPLLKELKTKLPIDAHLMVTNPEEQAKDYAEYSDVVYIHEETLQGKNIQAIVEDITSAGSHAGITINPETTAEDLEPILKYFTHVLVMSVHPGAGGQECILETLDKIPEIKNLKPDIIIAVDGGMNEDTAPIANKKGADVIVSGSFVLKSKNPKQSAESLRCLPPQE
ncbi:MAG: ribulose-phosphate 3-epimerase [Candidatus Gracilibacteria bacterium]